MEQIISNVKIVSTGSYAPEIVVTNQELIEENGIDTTDEWIQSKLGIKQRHRCRTDEYTSDLATKAAQNALDMAGMKASDIDLIVVATATPDYQAPSCASIVQAKLGCNCPAFDISAVCAGFIYALSIASDLVSIGTYKNALVIGADAFSKITNYYSDRNSVFFGDGSGCVIIQRGDYLCRNTMYFKLHTEGGKLGFNCRTGHTFKMNTKEVYEAATRLVPKVINETLELAHIGIHMIDLMIPHQPSITILKALAEKVGIPIEKVKMNMDRYANTSAGTIPILLDEVNRNGELKTGNKILMPAIGAGWAVGCGIITW